MFNITQFRQTILIPTLSDLQMYSKQAEELLVFTLAAESDGGTYLVQDKGPALGIFQCEPATHQDIWINYIIKRAGLISIMALKFNAPRIPEVNRLVYDIRYATCIARLHYNRVSEQLPDMASSEALYDYYKKYYNTAKGKATPKKAITQYETLLRQ